MVVDPLAELYASCDVGWSKAKRHPATSLTSSPLDGDETEGLPGFVATWKKEGTSAEEGPSTLLDRATGFGLIAFLDSVIGTYPRRCRYADIGLAGLSHQS